MREFNVSISALLEKYDRTEPERQREIVATFAAESGMYLLSLKVLLEKDIDESIKEELRKILNTKIMLVK